MISSFLFKSIGSFEYLNVMSPIDPKSLENYISSLDRYDTPFLFFIDFSAFSFLCAKNYVKHTIKQTMLSK